MLYPQPRRVCLTLLGVWVLVLLLNISIFYGENQHRQSIGKTFSHSVHAEINTLFKFLKKNNIYNLDKKSNISKKSVIYVVRLMNTTTNKSDNFNYLLGNSKPCSRCQCYLYTHNIKKIKYTNIINGINVLCEMRIKK